MDHRKELNNLCKTIKSLIPSNRKEDDVTDQFEQFIKDLDSKGIDPHEIECIRRAYNYFNFILKTQPMTLNGNVDEDENGDLDANESVDNGSPLGPPGPLSIEDQIRVLIDLYPKYSAINAMKILADRVLNEIPKIDVAWIKGSPIPKNSNTIVDRVSYQVEMAKKLDVLVPCKDLIELTKNVLRTASDLKQKSGLPKDPETTRVTKVTGLMEKAQEKVKEEIQKIPKV